MSYYDDDHEMFRSSLRGWLAMNVVPNIDQWEADGIVPRQLFADAGSQGFLGMAIAEEFGGGGIDDFRFNHIWAEELAYAAAGGSGAGFPLHVDVLVPYFTEFCNDEQKARWLPGIASGELITAVAMTEPGTGSDLAGVITTAIRDGDEYIINGSKTFITNGINSDLVVVVAKTDPSQRHGGMSLLVVERGMPGFERGRNLKKLGLHAQDTAELFFTDVRVPITNLLGDEGSGFRQLTHNLPQERLSLAVGGVAVAREALNWTIEYVRERTAFGKPVSSFQNTKFVLAEVSIEIESAEAFMRECVLKLNDDTLTPAKAARAKVLATDLQNRSVDRCLQLFGGYGFMMEYPIARIYADSRVSSIYGGTNEILKTIVAKDLGL